MSTHTGQETDKDKSGRAVDHADDISVPNKAIWKCTQDVSRSPDKTHKKFINKIGTIRKMVTDVPNNKRSRFFKIKYVPVKMDTIDSSNSPSSSVSQQAEEKKALLGAMTLAQRTQWHKGRKALLMCDKSASRYSWIDQALENKVDMRFV